MKLKLDKNDIIKYQKNRPPYLMIDHATEVIPGVSAKGYKDFPKDEWFFKVHWENEPNVPGMLQIESLVQMSALSILTLNGNSGKAMYLISANNIKFIKKILPNSRFNIETKTIEYKRGIAQCTGTGSVEGDIVCKADFSLILPDEVNKFKIK